MRERIKENDPTPSQQDSCNKVLFRGFKGKTSYLHIFFNTVSVNKILNNMKRLILPQLRLAVF